MYTDFFGFREKPFRLVPNPAYLFLSRGHEETLAHLAYAVSQDEGFVEITGEVGTGKTTLCRVFLDNLDDKTEAAYIFNPKLDALQLLKTINGEFDIDSGPDNPKDLIDALNRFLMARAGEGKHVILLIDEAQNLSRAVLEQIRLLSNLETSTRKLLQIILVGQPELHETLHSHDLRQLGQRISVSCNLEPLSAEETAAYIHHRIRIAARKPDVVFSPEAAHVVHRYSGGVPRLINMACDRALLTAFVGGRREITEAVAKSSIKELTRGAPVRRSPPGAPRRLRPRLAWILSVACLMTALLLIAGHGRLDVKRLIVETGKTISSLFGRKSTDPAPSMNTEEGRSVEVAGDPQKDENRRVAAFLEGIDASLSPRRAVEAVLSRWTAGDADVSLPGNGKDAADFFRETAKRNGFRLYAIEDDFDLMIKLNLPGIVEMRPNPGAAPRYLALEDHGDGIIALTTGGAAPPFRTPPAVFRFYWTGRAFIPWKNFHEITGTITTGADEEDIQKLKRLLMDIGSVEIESGPVYDEGTRAWIRRFQKTRGIEDDGIVGSLTKIILYNESKTLPIPRIRKAKKSDL